MNKYSTDTGAASHEGGWHLSIISIIREGAKRELSLSKKTQRSP